MNYLAHLFIAKPTAASCFGNLLGDFQRGVDKAALPNPVRQGLNTHLLVDKFTDTHPLVTNAKANFSPQRRRFSGIALDILFDHYLIVHWHRFSDQPFDDFCNHRYTLLEAALPVMPATMQRLINSMIKDQWLDVYATVDGVSSVLNRTAKRIRFKNEFQNSIEELLPVYEQLHDAFPAFFTDLLINVEQQSTESGDV